MTERGGGRSPDPDRSAPGLLTAHHEAGHAVVAVALGLGLKQVSIVGDRDALGRTDLIGNWPQQRPGFDPRSSEDRRLAESWILLALAGEYADARHGGRDPDPESAGALWDFRRAAELAERLFARPGEQAAYLEEMRRRARDFVGDPVRWGQIAAVAMQLGRDGELDGEQVGRIMEEIAAAAGRGDRGLHRPTSGASGGDAIGATECDQDPVRPERPDPADPI
jgi:hypothetical protein